MPSLLAALACTLVATVAGRSFVVQDDSFVLDGEKVQIHSSEIHYSRVPRAYWKDRLQRLQAMGMNAIATYVPWNWHEETEGNFNWEGDRDIVAFLQTAQDLGLLVLLRAGPYMCGEWEFGGLPAWILTKNVTIRTYEPNYISLVDRYWGALLDKVKPMLYSNGGPIVMMQVENEYGSYGDVSQHPADKQYMEHLVTLANSHLGKGSVVLYTTDGGNTGYMTRGSLKGDSVLTLGDGGWACSAQAGFNPQGYNPCMNSEDYTGWLTHWGESMANTTASDYGTGNAVAKGYSFNLYMGHGGSNFGFWSGANGGGKSYQPHITSYDYDSPVSENGDHGYGRGGDKFVKLLAAMKPFAPSGGFPAEPAPLPRKAYGDVHFTQRADLLKNLGTLAPHGPQSIEAPVSMETLGQNYGFIYYEANTKAGGNTIEITEYPRDRAQVFVNGAYNGAIYRPEAAPLKLKTAASAGSKLGLLVENMGRLNYGHSMTDPKGITTPVTLDGKDIESEWKAYSLPLEYKQLAALSYTDVSNCSELEGPIFYKGELIIKGTPEDTWLKPEFWNKGIMWVNGYNLGRYWEKKGPQHAFYVPAPFLKAGSNEVVILELETGFEGCTAKFVDKPDFSGSPSVPCTGTPKAGDVLHMRDCDSSLSDYMAWSLSSSGSRYKLSLGDLCLGSGPSKDAQSGQPSATLVDCASAVEFSMSDNQISHESQCLDITAQGQTAGERVDWYACQGSSYSGKNQLWDVKDTPKHTQWLVSHMDGKCLSSCSISPASEQVEKHRDFLVV